MIRISNVERTYRAGETEVRALRGVTLAIGPGEFLAIAGPSGSGKTTLLNLVGCIDRPDAGEITIDGKAVSRMDTASSRCSAGRGSASSFRPSTSSRS